MTQNIDTEPGVKTSKRSDRRHATEVVKKARSDYQSGMLARSTVEKDKVVGRLVHTAANCSCHMCGNPRKYSGEKTIQEKRAESFDRSMRNGQVP